MTHLADATASTSYADEFFVSRDHEIWPRRLLHVPTMTSHERQEGDVYGSAQTPKYNILSYTWGRWEIPSGPSLQINGITWPIPAIDPSRFTVKQFRNVIRQIAEDLEYVWIDVACIDQIRRDVKMAEIGNQAGIFAKAKGRFIWLHSLPTDTLQRSASSLFRCSARLDGDEEYRLNVDDEELITNFVDTEEDMETWLPPCLEEKSWVEDLGEALATITSDPWFSSLWTLQEAYLSADASVLSLEGVEIKRPAYGSTGLVTLVMAATEIDNMVERALDRADFVSRLSHEQEAKLQAVRSAVRSLGFLAYENATLLYTSASTRTCREPLDRIYAIMQIYGFRLGESADPSRQYSLSELELEFAVALNSLSPIWAQLFIRSQRPTDGRSWCVDQSCQLPSTFRFDYVVPSSQCRIALDHDRRPYFHGRTCPLNDLARMWSAAAADDNLSREFWKEPGMVHVLALDRSSFAEMNIATHLVVPAKETSPNHVRVTELLLNLRSEMIEVFVLGKLLQPVDLQLVDEIEDESAGTDSDVAWVGLLARKTSTNGKILWERLGVVLWENLQEHEKSSAFVEGKRLLC